MRGPTNPPTADNTSNVVTVDGSLGLVQSAAITANSTFIVQNIPRGGRLMLMVAAAGGARTMTPDGATVQAVSMAGGVTSFTVKSGVFSTIEFIALATGGVVAIQGWDGLYA